MDVFPYRQICSIISISSDCSVHCVVYLELFLFKHALSLKIQIIFTLLPLRVSITDIPVVPLPLTSLKILSNRASKPPPGLPGNSCPPSERRGPTQVLMLGGQGLTKGDSEPQGWH